MSRVIELKAIASGNWLNYNGYTKDTTYPECQTGQGNNGNMHSVAFIFWNNCNFVDGDNLKVKLNLCDYTGTKRNLYLGYYSSKETIDTVTYGSSKNKFYTIESPTTKEYEVEVPFQAINNGLCIYFDNYQNDKSKAEFDNIGRTNYPRALVTIEDATISDLTIDQLDADKNITVSWTSANQKLYELEAIQNKTTVLAKTGTIEQLLTIPFNTLPAGETKFRVRVANGFEGNIYWSEWVEKTVTLIKKAPVVSLLEPDRIQVRRENPIAVSFLGFNITSWLYECIQNNIVKCTVTGTTARETSILANVLANGTAKNRLTATYIPEWATDSKDYRTVVKETEFIVYGTPIQPTLTLDTTYSTPYPLFKWTNATEQISYRLKVKDTSTTVLDSQEVYSSTLREHKFDAALDNHKTYTVELSIKNQYGLWSTAVTTTFKVEFAELAQPNFNVYADENNACNVINLESPQDNNFHHHEIHRRTINGDWIKIAQDLPIVAEFRDYSVASGFTYEYKVRAIDANTAYKDSEIKACKCTFNKTILSVPFSDVVFLLKYNVEKSINNMEDRSFVLYSGLDKPKTILGATDYITLDFSCSFKSYIELQEFKAIAKERVLLLRDKNGLKAYGTISNIKESFKYPADYKITFNFTETYYKEGDLIESEQRPLSFVDSEW